MKAHLMSMLRNFILAISLLAALAALATPAVALDPNEMFDNPAREQRARDIGRQLRCLVCQNQSIFDSNAGLAHDLRVLVRERMSAGDSDDQVIDFIYTRYGDYVLLEPRKSGKTLVLWLTPIVALLFGLASMAVYLRRKSVAHGSPVTGQAASTNRLNEADRAAAKKLLQGDDT